MFFKAAPPSKAAEDLRTTCVGKVQRQGERAALSLQRSPSPGCVWYLETGVWTQSGSRENFGHRNGNASILLSPLPIQWADF